MSLPPPSRFRGSAALVLTVGLVVLFCLGLEWRSPLVFWNDDYQISILPVLADIARSWREGHWPLLSPYSWACGNLAGEYQYGTFSLFVNAVVVAVWHWPLSFGAQAAAMSITHLAALAAGAFLLARQRRLAVPLAAMVGVVSALNGWEIGWGATNWFGALAAHAWLPWAWWAFAVAMAPEEKNQPPVRRLRLLLPTPFVYLVLTGGFPYTVVMLMLISAWLALRALVEKRFRAMLPLVVGWLGGLGLSAPAWLSLLESIRGSGRAEGVGTGNHAWTVPLSALPGMVLPNWSTYWHNFSDTPGLHAALEMAGALVPVVGLIAGLACVRAWLVRVCHWDFLLLGAILLLCLLPSPGVFRWSFRWLPLLHIVVALIGAHAWELLGTRSEEAQPASRWAWTYLCTNGGVWMSALIALVWLAMAVFGTANPDSLTRPLPICTLGCGLLWFGLETAFARRDPPWRRWFPVGFALLSLWITYLFLPTNCGLPRYAFNASLIRLEPLSTDRLYLGFYPAPEKSDVVGMASTDRAALLRPGSTNLFAGLRFVNGYSPIMGPGIGRRWRMATHGEIPPEIARRLLLHEAGPDGEMARLGVDGLVIARNFPLDVQPPADEWSAVFSSPQGTVYHRRGRPLPSAALAQPVSITPGPGASPPSPSVLENTRQRVIVDVSSLPAGAPTILEFHRPFFPGYVASLDGVLLPVVPSPGGLMPSVRLPAGRHRSLILRYLPVAVVWGASLAGVTLLALGIASLVLFRPGTPAVGL